MISSKPSLVYLGSGWLHFNGNSTFTSTNTVFYIDSGSTKWNGNTRLVMSAPTSGIYKGMLFYMPITNTSTFLINGNSNAEFVGSIFDLGGTIKINGNSDTTAFHSRIIGHKINLIGNADLVITFNAEENYESGSSDGVYVELVK